MKKKFKIEKMEPNGSGISFLNNEVNFVSKVIPGEEGICHVFKSKKNNLFFSKLESINDLDKVSDKRTQPKCIHYQDCNGCQYLHVDEETEKKWKINALDELLNKFYLKNTRAPIDFNINFIESNSRFGYRNRVQLHYNLEKNLLGYINSNEKNIIPVNNCLLPTKGIQKYIDILYQNDYWKTLLKKNSPPKGHIEIQEINEKIITNINKKYSHGGFNQVNNYMNTSLKNLILKIVKDYNFHSCIDLFGGNGNLSNHLPVTNKTIVEIEKPRKLDSPETQFLKMNLFKDDLKKLTNYQADLMIIDPPRSGFDKIKTLIEFINPSLIIYVSCHPATLARDLSQTKDIMSINSVHLLNMFPGTKHFETLITLKPKSN